MSGSTSQRRNSNSRSGVLRHRSRSRLAKPKSGGAGQGDQGSQGGHSGRTRLHQEKIDSVIASAFAGLGIAEELHRYSFVTHWPEIVGTSIASKTRPECLRNKTLVVRVPDSSWAQELSLRREVILARLKPLLTNNEEVTDVMFYVAGEEVGLKT